MRLGHGLSALVLTFIAFFPAAGHAQDAPPDPCKVQPLGTVQVRPPDYPFLSQRTSEQGSVGMTVTIRPDGSPSDVAIATSSGYDRLDRAAIAWVKDRKRWLPFTNGCTTSVVRPLNLLWDLRTVPNRAYSPEFTLLQSAYPPAALAAKEQGTAEVTATMMADGVVRKVEIVVSSGYVDLDEKTRELAPDIIKNHWKPRIVNGEPVITSVRVDLHWTLKPPRVLTIQR